VIAVRFAGSAARQLRSEAANWTAGPRTVHRGAAPERPPVLSADLWLQVFANRNPVSFEIGPGRGHFLLESARADPQRNFFAVERSRASARLLEQKLARAGVSNVRLVAADARWVLPMLPGECVDRFHIQFPDPWWKRRHGRRRLITPWTVAQLARSLVPGGTVELVTDVGHYFELAARVFAAEPLLEPAELPHTAQWASTFARKAQARGSAVWACLYRRRPLGPL